MAKTILGELAQLLKQLWANDYEPNGSVVETTVGELTVGLKRLWAVFVNVAETTVGELAVRPNNWASFSQCCRNNCKRTSIGKLSVWLK